MRTSQEDGSQEEYTARAPPGQAGGREYHVVETKEDALQDSSSLDMEGNQEEGVSASLNTIETRQDRSQEGSGGGMNVATPVPSDSLSVHQAARMIGRQEVDLLDTRRSFMNSMQEEDASTVKNITRRSVWEDAGGP